MITKKRLNELIEKGAEIWHLCGRKDIMKTNARDIPTHYRLNNFKNWELYKEYYFETKEDVEFSLEFQNITRTETLNLPTWEEIEYDKIGRFIYSFHIKNNYKFFGKLTIWKNIQLITIEGLVQGCQYELYFDEPLTKENYLEACKIAKKLFLGEGC